MSDESGESGESGESHVARTREISRKSGPPAAMLVGLTVFMVVLAAFLVWMLSKGGETEVQRNLRELDSRVSPAPRGEPPFPASTGKLVYEAQCVSCHGVAASGGPGGPALVTKRYTPPRWEDQDLANVIYGGRGAMPSFADRLSVEELAAVVAYIRWEQGLPVPGAKFASPPA